MTANTNSLDWINEVLPLLRCPDSHQPLRWADADDLVRHGLPGDVRALTNSDGTQLFPIDQGIPILLPQATRSNL